jgi:hypothetical protein
MATSTTVRLLERLPNQKGDLFARLMNDFFLSLGYDDCRFNIHKSGREIDVEASHRTENRRMIAECKATDSPIGGADTNKFVGSLDAEQRRSPDKPTVGYFISLSGFTETAKQQEKDLDNKRFIEVDGSLVVKELIAGNILVSRQQAAERAGRCAAAYPDARIEKDAEVLAHHRGWIWAFYFTANKERRYFSLIHADGEALSSSLAEEIVHADQSVRGHLSDLVYLSPQLEPSHSETAVRDEVKSRYFGYIANEYGSITLEGLPADQEVGSRQLQLESIFVPLHLTRIRQEVDEESLAEVQDAEDPEPMTEQREAVGEVLAKHHRLAILAAPGGGKSTLLKRLAVAYAFPERREDANDNLPSRDWLPLIIRCRQLDSLAEKPIRDVLRSIGDRAELSTDLSEAFDELISEALRSGNALILIDGLDELSDERQRVSFVKQLRTFLAMYPAASVVVTSREAGFRIVGGALSSTCEHYTIADFDEEDIARLTVAWHKEVVGPSDEVIADAKKLAENICNSDRVQRLAQNPLLLTTLLLVKRWVGEVPRKRSVLYGKAIEVLLMTWNVEGHEPIDQDEAIPQLAFIAFAMMSEGIQAIPIKRLRELIRQAREEMPEILGYARMSVNDFVRRIEDRSSVLSLSGHIVEEGRLSPIYEFKHLTFQEYLSAVAVVDGYYPGRKDNDSISSVLTPRINDQAWKEVIPLAAVLGGRHAAGLVDVLIKEVRSEVEKERDLGERPGQSLVVDALSQCLSDEAQLPPAMVETASNWLPRASYLGLGEHHILDIMTSRYAHTFRTTVERVFANADSVVTDGNKGVDPEITSIGSVLAQISLHDIQGGLRSPRFTVASRTTRAIQRLVTSGDDLQMATGALTTMIFAYRAQAPGRGIRRAPTVKQTANHLGRLVTPLLWSDRVTVHLPAAWSLAWLARVGLDADPKAMVQLFELWRRSTFPDLAYLCSWPLISLPLLERDAVPLGPPTSTMVKFIRKEANLSRKGPKVTVWQADTRKAGALVMAYYLGSPYTDEQLKMRFRRLSTRARELVPVATALAED